MALRPRDTYYPDVAVSEARAWSAYQPPKPPARRGVRGIIDKLKERRRRWTTIPWA